MLTGAAKRQVDIPHEPGQWLVLRVLSGKKLDESREKRAEAQLKQQLGILRGAGSDVIHSFFKLHREAAGSANGQSSEAAPDPLDEYDTDTLLYSGIVGWSYAEDVSPAAIDELDPQTRDWAARELIAPTLPKTDEQRLERFLPSTPPSTA